MDRFKKIMLTAIFLTACSMLEASSEPVKVSFVCNSANPGIKDADGEYKDSQFGRVVVDVVPGYSTYAMVAAAISAASNKLTSVPDWASPEKRTTRQEQSVVSFWFGVRELGEGGKELGYEHEYASVKEMGGLIFSDLYLGRDPRFNIESRQASFSPLTGKDVERATNAIRRHQFATASAGAGVGAGSPVAAPASLTPSALLAATRADATTRGTDTGATAQPNEIVASLSRRCTIS